MRYPAFESPALAENSPMITLLSQKMTAKNTKKEEQGEKMTHLHRDSNIHL